MIDASPEARWFAENPSLGEGLFSGRGRRILTLYYAWLGRGGWRTLSMAEAGEKREVGANSEEVKLIENKV